MRGGLLDFYEEINTMFAVVLVFSIYGRNQDFFLLSFSTIMIHIGKRYLRILSSIVISILILIASSSEVLAYDLSSQDISKGDEIIQKINTIINTKPPSQQQSSKEYILSLLEQFQMTSQANERLSALIGYVIGSVKGGTNPSPTTASLPADEATGAQVYSPAITYSTGQTFTWSGATVTVTAPGVGTSSTKATGCDTNDIVVWA